MRKEIDLYDEGLKEAILSLPYSSGISDTSDMVFIPESDYGFAEIYRMYDDYLLFLIPPYGGTPSFYKAYQTHTINNLIKDLKEIT